MKWWRADALVQTNQFLSISMNITSDLGWGDFTQKAEVWLLQLQTFL